MATVSIYLREDNTDWYFEVMEKKVGGASDIRKAIERLAKLRKRLESSRAYL